MPLSYLQSRVAARRILEIEQHTISQGLKQEAILKRQHGRLAVSKIACDIEHRDLLLAPRSLDVLVERLEVLTRSVLGALVLVQLEAIDRQRRVRDSAHTVPKANTSLLKASIDRSSLRALDNLQLAKAMVTPSSSSFTLTRKLFGKRGSTNPCRCCSRCDELPVGKGWGAALIKQTLLKVAGSTIV